MPSITAQPSTSNFFPAYGDSLDYTITQTFTSGDPIPALEARVSINGTLFSTQFYPAASTSGTTATFQININGIVQEYFRSLNAYPGTFVGYVNTSSTSTFAGVTVAFYAWLANADGLLELTGSPATSNTCRVINSAQTNVSGFHTTSNRKFLTNKPNKTLLKTNEGEILAIYTAVTSELVLKTYSENGTLQRTYTKSLTGTGARIVLVGVGIPNLVALDGVGWNTETGTALDFLNGGRSAYYTIEVQQAGGAVFTETRTYYIDNSSDCLAYRIYFLNRLGFYDGVSLYQSKLNTFETQSLQFESPASELFPNPVNRLYTKLANGFGAHFLGMTDAETTWLKELAATVDAYEGSTANPVFVEDGSFTEKDTYAAMNDLFLQFKYSNLVYSQRN